jgi:predicted component of type VI protein secretion system
MSSPAQEAQQESSQPQSLREAIADTYEDLDVEETEEFQELEAAEEEVTHVEEAIETEEETEVEAAEGEEEIIAEAEEGEEPEAVEAAKEEWNEPAPERWPEEMKEVYQSLPPAARRAMLEQVFKPMQRTYTEATQELSQMRATLEPMLQTMQQHSGELQSMGLDPAEALRRQMAWASHFARVGPEQGLADMANAYGVQQGNGQAQADDEYLTPVERALKARVDRFEQHLGQQQQQSQQAQQDAQQAAQAQRAQALRAELTSFVTEEKDGKPAHPHVEKVGHAMAGLVRGGLVERFDEYGQEIPVKQQIAQAYNIAINMNPSLRTVKPTGSNEQVEMAKRANSTVVSKQSGSAPVDEGPLRDSISDLYDRLDKRTTRPMR